MNSLTEQERLGLDDVFMSISANHNSNRPFEQIKVFFTKIDFKKHMKKPKNALLSIKKGFKKSKNQHFWHKNTK